LNPWAYQQKLEAKDYEANSARTFFFLPHCEDWLNEAVLSGLIATSSLQNAVLIMNDIRKYPLTKKKVHQATVKVLNGTSVTLLSTDVLTTKKIYWNLRNWIRIRKKLSTFAMRL